MNGATFPDDHRSRQDAAVWLTLTLLWRFGTGRPLFTVDGWWLTRSQRAAYRWTLIVLLLGVLLAPRITIAAVVAAGAGFTAGAIWARGVRRPRLESAWTPPDDVERTRTSRHPTRRHSTDQLRPTDRAAVLPLWRPTRKDP